MKNYLLIFVLCFLCLPLRSQTHEMELDLFESMQKSDKAAVVAVHLGADSPSAITSIEAFNAQLHNAFSDYDFREAWTSRSLINKVDAEAETRHLTPDELLSVLLEEGYTHVLLQTSFLINDTEQQALQSLMETEKARFKQIRLGAPLLSNPDDYNMVASTISTSHNFGKDAVVIVCQSPDQEAFTQYTMLESILRGSDLKNWFAITIGGYPTCESTIRQLKAQKIKKATLVPFHFPASNNIAEDVQTEFKKEGIKTTILNQSQKETDSIVNIFINHAKHAQQYRKLSAREIKLISEQ